MCLHADYDSKSPAGNVFCAVGRDVVGVSTPIFPPLVFCRLYSIFSFSPSFRFLSLFSLFSFSIFFSFFSFCLVSPSTRKKKEKRKASTRMLSATTQRGLSGRFFARKIMAAIWTCDDEIV